MPLESGLQWRQAGAEETSSSPALRERSWKMKIIDKGRQDSSEEILDENYEYRLCGGAVEPEDRKGPAEEAGDTGESAGD